MAVDLMEMLKGAVSQQLLGKIAGTLGIDQKKVSPAFEMVSGAILGGLLKKASSPQGAQKVYEAAKNQDNSILDKLGDLLGGGQQTEAIEKSGGSILETVFGDQQSDIIGVLSKAVGFDKGIIQKLMAMVGPILMAVIGRHIKSKALDAVGLGKLLGEQKSSLGKYMPAALAGNLGLSNFIGDANAAVSGAANSARDMSRAASHATTEAAAKGGRLLKLIVPLVLLAILAFAVWNFFLKDRGNAPAVPDAGQMTQGAKEGTNGLVDRAKKKLGKIEIPGMDFDDLDISGLGEAGATLKNGFGDITSGFASLKDEAGANQLKEKISGFSGKLDELGLGDLAGPAKTVAQSMIGMFTEKVKSMLENVPAPLKAIIEPAIEGLMEKLKPLMG